MEFMPQKDLNKHRTCDRSMDGKVITILRDGCLTVITANADGTLNVNYEVVSAA